MKEKFCPGCGKETDDLIKGLCKKCFAGRTKWIDMPDILEATVCKRCGRKKVGKWKEISMEEALKRNILNRSDHRGEVQDIQISILGQQNRADVTIKGVVENVEMEKKNEVGLKVEEKICRDCKKISTRYFEATVQIRTEEDILDDVLSTCETILKERRGTGPVVSDLEKTKNGVNIFIVSNSVAKYLARKLAEEYTVERKDSKTLRGLEDGNKSYRSTYLVRILEK